MSKSAKNTYINGRNPSGQSFSKWIQYNENLKVLGSYEYRSCFILDKMKDAGIIKDWEYTNDRVQYVGEDDKNHSYCIDFKII